MTPRFERQITFASWLNQGILDPNHKLFRLAEVIDWEAIHDKVAPFYSNRGPKALPAADGRSALPQTYGRPLRRAVQRSGQRRFVLDALLRCRCGFSQWK